MDVGDCAYRKLNHGHKQYFVDRHCRATLATTSGGISAMVFKSLVSISASIVVCFRDTKFDDLFGENVEYFPVRCATPI
jgi:hypothetical protein